MRTEVTDYLLLTAYYYTVVCNWCKISDM